MATDTSVQERKFRSLFDHLDADKDGAISWKDGYRCANRARQELGWTQEDPRFTKILQAARASWDTALQSNDLDHNGSISYKEYITFLFKTAVESVVSGKLPAWVSWAFQTAGGKDGLTLKEYAIYLRSIGSDADPKSVFTKLDINKNGKITQDEFQVLLKQFVGSNDPSSPGNYLLTGKF